MEPTLRDGDRIDVRPAHGRDARIGDVVLALNDGTTVLHRVIARADGRIRTQGDALRTPDPPVDDERVLGIACVPRRVLFARLRGGVAALRRAVQGSIR